MVGYLFRPVHCPPLYHAGISLADKGYDVEAIGIFGIPDGYTEEVIVPGFTSKRFFLTSLHYFESRYGLGQSSALKAAVQYLFTYSEFLWKAFRAAFRSDADLYEAHDLPALLPTAIAALARGKPLVYYAHELYPEMHARVHFAGLWKLLESALVPLAHLVVTPERNRSLIMLREYHARSMPLTVLNCPPFREPVQGTVLRDRLAGMGVRQKTIVLYQGLIDSSRCMEELVQASHLFNDDIVLVLIGHKYNEWMKKTDGRYTSDRMVVIPHIPYEELFAYTASADLGILFYRNDCRNNFYCAPNKLHEYMMMGLPVVTCDYPGLKEIVEREETGICVNPEDPRAIADAVNRIAMDNGLRNRMKENGLRVSRELYHWDKEFVKIDNAYQLLFRSRGENSYPSTMMLTHSAVLVTGE